MFWTPAHAWRGRNKPWFHNPRLNELEMSVHAAKLIYRHFNLCPDLYCAENDRDHCPW